jgi:hypothetical protein
LACYSLGVGITSLLGPSMTGLSIDLFGHQWIDLLPALISLALGLGLGCCSPLSMIITCNRAPALRRLIPSKQQAQAHSR